MGVYQAWQLHATSEMLSLNKATGQLRLPATPAEPPLVQDMKSWTHMHLSQR